MVKTILGMKGSGKTKKLVDLVIEAVNEANGDVVVIEKDRKLTFDIPYQARLIDAGIYDIGSYEFLKGAICGIHSGNYDITHIFIDNFFKLVNDKSEEAVTEFFTWLSAFSEKENIEFVISISCDEETAPAILKELAVYSKGSCIIKNGPFWPVFYVSCISRYIAAADALLTLSSVERTSTFRTLLPRFSWMISPTFTW